LKDFDKRIAPQDPKDVMATMLPHMLDANLMMTALTDAA
jgi:hypothetical protein